MHRNYKTDWNDLKLLLSVSSSGSFNKASAELGIDQATVSRRIANLEFQAKTPLFQRRTTGAHPAEACLKLIDAAREASVAVEKFDRCLREAEQPSWVRVSAPEGLATYLLAPSFAGDGLDNPLKLTMPTGDMPQVQFVQFGEQADIDIIPVAPGGALPVGSDIKIKRIGKMNFVALANNKYLTTVDRPSSVSELANHHLLQHALYNKYAPFSAWCEIVHECRGKPRLIASTSSALHRSVVAGAGITMLPDFSPIIDSQIVVLDCGIPKIALDLFLASHPDNLRLNSVRVAYETIGQMFTRSPWFHSR
jgi:DNA-binding transcriptional LysR family regulator